MMRRVIPLACFLVGLSPGLLRADDKKLDIRNERDLVFGKGGATELKLDLAMPKEGDGPFPVVVCIHGGGWIRNDRQQMHATIDVLAGRGYVAVSPSYRLAPDAKFPAQIEDVKACVRWLRANAKTYKINPDRIGAIGFSAGAHLACLLGVTDKDDGLEGEGGNADQSSRVQCVVSFFGPTDLTSDGWPKKVVEDNLIPFLGGSIKDKPEQYKKASPITYVKKDAPPFLFFHGDKDKTVNPEQSNRMCEALKKAGGSAAVIVMEGEEHGWAGEKLKDSIDKMIVYLDVRLKKK
jgi:acetyl esterase/lipase